LSTFLHHLQLSFFCASFMHFQKSQRNIFLFFKFANKMSFSKSSHQNHSKPVKASQLFNNLAEMSKMLQVLINNSQQQSSGTPSSSSSSLSSSSMTLSSVEQETSSGSGSTGPSLTIAELRALVPPNLYDQLCISNDITQVTYIITCSFLQ
jgi:hypothetical protein